MISQEESERTANRLSEKTFDLQFERLWLCLKVYKRDPAAKGILHDECFRLCRSYPDRVLTLACDKLLEDLVEMPQPKLMKEYCENVLLNKKPKRIEESEEEQREREQALWERDYNAIKELPATTQSEIRRLAEGRVRNIFGVVRPMPLKKGEKPAPPKPSQTRERIVQALMVEVFRERRSQINSERLSGSPHLTHSEAEKIDQKKSGEFLSANLEDR